MRKPGFMFIALWTLLNSCEQQNAKYDSHDYLITEKDIIPEGVAFDANTGTIYVSSTYKRKIVAIKEDGTVEDFIKEGQDDIKSVIGMEVDPKTKSLWAVSSEAMEVLPLKNPGVHQWRSSVCQFSLSGGNLIKKYKLNKDSVFLNDLAVGPDGTVFITESVKNAVYRIIPGSDTLSLFIEPRPYTFINGICFSDERGTMYVTSEQGIISIDIDSRIYKLLHSNSDNKALGIDGISFYKNSFIAHQSVAVSRFYLDENRDTILKVDTLNTGKEFDGSTTGEVSSPHYYFIVNSQIQSGIDYAKKEIKLSDSLENIIVRKIKLD